MNVHKKAQVMLVVMLLLLTAVLPAAAQDEKPLTEEEKANLAVVEKFFALYNDQDSEAIGELLTDDVVWTRVDPSKYLWLGSRAGEGVEGALAMYADDQSNTMWNMWVSLVDARVEGDTVQTLELWENGLLRRLRTPLVERSTFHIRDGKIAEWEAAFTELGTQRVLERDDRDTAVNSFAEILSIGHLKEALTYVADDAVFVFPLDPLTGKRVEVTGKENIAAYLEGLASHRFSYNLSELYSHPRHLQGYGYVTWNELKAMGLPSLPTNDKFEVKDGKVVRFELLPLPVAQRLYSLAAAQEANKEIVRSAVEAFIAADAGAIAQYYAEDAVRRDASIVNKGIEAIQARAELLRAGFNDFACTQDKLTASGDQVFAQGTCTGTVSAAVEEPAAAGKTVTFQVLGAYTLKDGKIVEESLMYDTADIWRQLGFELVPAE
jgi:ketosteroid isomerase-like protein